VTPADWKIKEVPGSPGAPAIQLYYAQLIDDSDQDNEGEYIYRRIKILNEQGLKYANVEVQLGTGFTLYDLKARVLHPGGAIVEVADKPFDKIIAKGKGFRYIAKTLTLPGAAVGSIVEYRYRIGYPMDELPLHEWVVQHELYTVREEFSVRRYTGAVSGVEGAVGLVLFKHLPRDAKVQAKGDGFELKMENVPAFEPEAYMPPSEAYLYRVTMAYGGREMASSERFWQNAGQRWNDEAERFMHESREVRETALATTAQATDLEQKLRLLYARVQKIRNLSYERDRNEEEKRRQNLKPNQNAGDVLERGYGDAVEIARLFASMARAAGFETWLLRVGNRGERIFDRNVLSAAQLEDEIVVIKLDDKEIYLDPGTPYCPYGLLRWFHTSTKALKLDKKGDVFMDVPQATFAQAVTRRNADLTLDDDGTLRGTVSVRYEGSAALERRLEALSTDDAGRATILGADMKDWLPKGASASFESASGWESADDALEARFTITVPGYGAWSGKRMFFPAGLFQVPQKEAFKLPERRFAVYFPFAFEDEDRIKVRLPAGAAMETVAQPQSARIGYATYQTASRFDGNLLATDRVLRLNGIFFRPDQYADVKSFFAKVKAADEQPMVLQSSGTRALREMN